MTTHDEETPSTTDRRSLIKKAAVAGGIVWAGPVVTSTLTPAAAASGEPPVEPPCVPVLPSCSALATALNNSGPAASVTWDSVNSVWVVNIPWSSLGCTAPCSLSVTNASAGPSPISSPGDNASNFSTNASGFPTFEIVTCGQFASPRFRYTVDVSCGSQGPVSMTIDFEFGMGAQAPVSCDNYTPGQNFTFATCI